MIKNVILDMGNVLLDYNPQAPLDAFCTSEREKTAIRRELFGGPEWIQADKGTIKNAELFDLVKRRVPEESWPALKRCCERWDMCMKPIEGAKSFCEYARSRNYRVYVLSNANDRFYDYFERLLPRDFFDGIVVSFEIRLIKPDRKCYEYILDKYRLNADECLFIDDRLDNVNAAKEVGMRACQFRNDFGRIISDYL